MKLALGTVQFGLNYGINCEGKIPKNEIFQIIELAIENKIDTFDTSPAYGKSEEILGEFILEKQPDLNIISKLPLGHEHDVENVFKKSLKTLNSERFYGYLIHNMESFYKNHKVWNNFKQLKDRGVVEKIGFSLYHPEELKYILEKNISFDLLQIPFSIFDQRFSETFDLLKDKNVEIHARSIFLQGLMFKNLNKLEKRFIKIQPKLIKLKKISESLDVSLSSICINFANKNKYIDKILIGVDNINNLQENLEALKTGNKVEKIYEQLLNLAEEDLNVILPTNW